MRPKLIALAALVALTAACGGSEATFQSSPTPSARPSSTAKIRIVEPASGATVEGPEVRVRVTLEGARILEQASTDIRPDTGHMHLKIDGRTVTLLAGLEYVIADVQPGTHLIQAEFAAADHGSFNPPVLAAASITVT